MERGFFNRAAPYRLRLDLAEVPRVAEWICETERNGAGWLICQLRLSSSQSLLQFEHRGWRTVPDYYVSCNTSLRGSENMAICQTGGYRVKASSVEKIKSAIKAFVPYVIEHEPGTQMYLAWQGKADPTRFEHLFIFEDTHAQTVHGQSKAVEQFEKAYTPELVGGDVVFTDYEMIAGKRDAFGTSEAREVVAQFYDAVVARDLVKARTFLSANLLFAGLFETYRGPDEYLNALNGLLQITIRLEVRKIVGQGDDAAIFFDLETKAPAEAKVLVAEWHRLENGKIAQVRSAFDGRPYATMFQAAGRG